MPTNDEILYESVEETSLRSRNEFEGGGQKSSYQGAAMSHVLQPSFTPDYLTCAF